MRHTMVTGDDERVDDDVVEDGVEQIIPTWDADTLVMDRYLLKDRLGKGGMGEVWRATDQVIDQDVAVKFLIGEVDREARHRFAAEVRAMARLDHPHIVSVLDQGEFEDAPLFIMNRLIGLPLGRWLRMANWEHMAIVFNQVLDALGYAHARGLIHRDLKPSNIMITGTPDHPHAMVLDYGIAIDPWSDGLVTGEIVGSPGYMAPEQRRGETWRARESTDLYAFGVILYEALCGRSPFGKGAKRPASLESPSFLYPRAKFPLLPRRGYEAIAEELETLLKKLLSLQIGDRPLLAYDVREELSRAVDRALHAQGGPGSESFEVGISDEEGPERTELMSPWHPVHLAPRALTTELPPGAYGLYGLRPPPVLGRDDELRQMWRAARRAFASGKPGVMFLEGINGIGKHALAAHLCERAHEQGLARYVEVSYVQNVPEASGLDASLEGILRVRHSLDRESTRGRIQGWMKDERAEAATLEEALLGLLRPSDEGHRGPALSSHLFVSVVKLLCHARAIVVVINDVQWCEDQTATALVEEMLALEATPVLIIATVSVDEQQPSFAATYAELLEHPNVERLTLGPLPEGALRSLLRCSISLDPDLEDQLVRRSEGLPFLASQLLDELVREGALERGPRGAKLKPERGIAALPRGIRSLWGSRIDRVQSTDEDGSYWVDALQGLALARVELTRPVINAAGQALGEPLDEAIAAWEREGLLIEEGDRGVRFSHSELTRVVAGRISPEAAVRWNIIWAATLAQLDHDHRGRHGFERGVHLLEAGEPEEALNVLLASAEQAHTWGDAHRTEQAAAKAAEIASQLHDRIRLAWALRWRGGAALSTGRIDEAERLLEKARKLFEAQRVLVGVGSTMEAMGWSYISKAAYEPAVELCTYGAEAYRRAGDEVGLAMILSTLGLALARSERYAEAKAVLNEAEDVARRTANERALAGALKAQGDCARYRGALEKSDTAYQNALEIAERKWRGAIPELHDGLGLVALARGELDSARERIAKALELVRMTGQKRLQVAFSADLAVAALLSDDPGEAVRHLEAFERGLASLDHIDEHAQWALEKAINPKIALRHPALAQRTADLAADLWDRLDRKDEASRVRELFQDLLYGKTVRE